MAQEVNVGLPQDLDLQQGYTLRVTALDSNGAPVAGVKVSTVVITADDGSVASSSGGGGTVAVGEWFLVPGQGA